MADEPDFGTHLLRLSMEQAERIEDNRRAGVVADLAAITLLIDAGLPIEAACERLELIQSVLPEAFQSEGVTARIGLLTQFLRGHAKPDSPGWSPRVIEGGKDQD